jgi:hypothetical protein
MNILSAYVTRLWNFREEMLWFNVHEDKGTKLERKSKDSKQWLKDSQLNVTADQRQVLKIWENYITQLYDRPNWPEHL